MSNLIKFSIFLLAFIIVQNVDVIDPDKNRGAYVRVPDESILQYRLGNGFGNVVDTYKYIGNLSLLAGFDGHRRKLTETRFVDYSYGIDLDFSQVIHGLGIIDVVGYLTTPTKMHSSNITDNTEFCYPSNLYEPIWLENGEVNPNNYWASYVYKTIYMYRDHIKIWETWNEPDYTSNYKNVGKWSTEPPDPKDLSYWHGTIFEYIRLLRITYEVAKKIDQQSWVATGGLNYTSFLDAIMRYTDNPDGGKVTREFPSLGGAYFDCVAYRQNPQYGVTDEETGDVYNGNGSDSLAKKVVIMKKNHHLITKKYGFGERYPSKLFINIETGLNSGSGNGVGGDLVRRNWILKLALLCIEYDVRQLHTPILADDDGGIGDYEKVNPSDIKNLKSSSKGRIVLRKMNLGKYVFDEEKTEKFRKSLPESLTGIALKRKFPEVEGEPYYYDYMYSVWVYCEKEEIEKEVKTKLDIPFNPLVLDWEENKKEMKKTDEFTVSNTPIFLLGNEK